MKVRLARPRKEAASISLFPFMDVFLCIKGALILMFIVIAQSSGDPMIKAVYPTAHVAPDQLAEERASLERRIEQLESSRDAAAKAMDSDRGEFARLDDEAHRLGERLADAKRAAGEMARSVVDDEALRALRAERSEIEARLAAARHATVPAETGEPKYAIIPHIGSGGTHRRPIYIECRREAIILQPEGVVLGDADFLVQARDNPLASGLEAARAYLERYAADKRQEGEPYPLLLVRPDGIAAYHVARLAIRNLNCEFGYELIDGDWKLDCGSADKNLAQVMNQAVESARGRQIQLALSAPSLLSSQQRDALRAAAQANGGSFGRGGRGCGTMSGDGPGGLGSNPYASVGSDPGASGFGPGGAVGGAPGAGAGGGRYGAGGGGSGPGGRGVTSGGAGSDNPWGSGAGFGSGSGGVGSHGSVGNTPLAGDNNPYALAATGSGTGAAGMGTGSGPGNALGASGSPSGMGGAGPGFGGGGSGTDGPMLGGSGSGSGSPGSGPVGFLGAGGSGGANGFSLPSEGSGPGGGGSGSGGGNPYASVGEANGTGTGSMAGGGAASGAGSMSAAGAGSGGSGSGQAGSGGSSPGGTGSPSASSGSGSAGGSGGGGASGSAGGAGGMSSSMLGASGGQSGGSPGIPGIPNLSFGAGPSGSTGSQGGGGNGATSSGSSTSGKSYASRSRPSSGSAEGQAGAGSSDPSAKGSGTQGDGTGGSDGKPGQGKSRGATAPPSGPVDITRPIVVECHADRLVLVGEDGTGRNNQVVALKGNNQESLRELFGDVQQRVESWGLAGRGMQWKPVLTVQVAPDGAARYNELKPLLESSGIEVQRSAQAPASSQPVARPRHRIWRWFTRDQD